MLNLMLRQHEPRLNSIQPPQSTADLHSSNLIMTQHFGNSKFGIGLSLVAFNQVFSSFVVDCHNLQSVMADDITSTDKWLYYDLDRLVYEKYVYWINGLPLNYCNECQTPGKIGCVLIPMIGVYMITG